MKTSTLAKTAGLGIGVLAGAVLAFGAAWAGQQTRTSGFEYFPAGHAHAGLLKKEIIEPGFSDLCLVTEYDYDAYGNRIWVNTRNCNGSSYGGSGGTLYAEAPAPTGTALFQARTSTSGYTSDSATPCAQPPGYVAGRYPIKRTNALGHYECLEYAAKFGALSKLTGPNGLATNWTYDAFGRKTSETRPDQSWTNWSFGWTQTGVFSALSGTQHSYYVGQSSSGAPGKFAMYDILNRQVGEWVEPFSGSAAVILGATQYDNRGRASKVFEPYYELGPGSAGGYTQTTYDDLNRPVSLSAPSGALTTHTYAGLSLTASVDPDGGGPRPAQTRKSVSNALGQLVSVRTNEGSGDPALDTTLGHGYALDLSNTIHTTTDALGNLTTVKLDLRGRKVETTDPDMGR